MSFKQTDNFKDIELNLRIAVSKNSPQIKVFLKRQPERAVLVGILVFKDKLYIYDSYADKYYTMKDYGSKWALVRSELL